MTDVHARDADEERHRLQYSTAPRIGFRKKKMMDPPQPSKNIGDPSVGRGSLTPVKQVPSNQNRSPGAPPGSPRYPLNNGSAGGPRLGGQPPPNIHRLDSRSSLNSPTGARPVFGPSRPQTAPLGNFSRPPVHFPSPGSASGPRGSPYPGAGSRPLFHPAQIRLQRPASLDLGASQPGIRLGPPIDSRPVTPRIIPETIVTSPPVLEQIRSQSREKMQSPDILATEIRRSKSQNEDDSNGDDDDDDDVIIDNEKESKSPENPMNDQDSGIPSEKIETSACPSPATSDNATPIPAEDSTNEEKRPTSAISSHGSATPDLRSKSDAASTEPLKSSNSEEVKPESEGKFDETKSRPSSVKSGSSAQDVVNPSPGPRSTITSAGSAVLGFDNGKPRSLTPKSPTPKSSPQSLSPKPPQTPKSPSPINAEIEKSASPSPEPPKSPSNNSKDDKSDGQISPKPELLSSVVSPAPSKTPEPADLDGEMKKSPTPEAMSPALSKRTDTPNSLKPESDASRPPSSALSPARSVSPKVEAEKRTPTPTSPSPIPPKSPSVASLRAETPDNTSRASKSRSPTSPMSARSIKMTKEAEDEIQSRSESPAVIEKPEAPSTDSSVKRSTSGKSIKSDTGINNAVGQSSPTNTVTTNGVGVSPTKKAPTKPKDLEKVKPPAGSPVKSPSKSVKSLPRTPEAGPPSIDKKKVPMNKVQVGAAPSPNLKTVRSKIGSLENTSYKPGGGKVKIENRKLDFSKAQSKIAAKNDKYTPSGGDKKITQMKLQWNAKPKVGSLDNATYKPGGGDKKIETVKLDFKDKAKPKVGSKDNAKHVPGGGTIKTPPTTPPDVVNDIETQKVEVKAESKIGSLDNVKHKPGGGDKKIFNDKDYLRQTSSNAESVNGSGDQSPVPPNTMSDGKNGLPTSDENLNQEC